MALEEDLAHQGVAVGVEAVGGQADDAVAHRDVGAVDDLVPLHHPHHEAGQVVVPGLVDAGHLRGLPADQGAAGLAAPLGDALDDLDGDLGGQAAPWPDSPGRTGAWPRGR